MSPAQALPMEIIRPCLCFPTHTGLLISYRTKSSSKSHNTKLSRITSQCTVTFLGTNSTLGITFLLRKVACEGTLKRRGPQKNLVEPRTGVCFGTGCPWLLRALVRAMPPRVCETHRGSPGKDVSIRLSPSPRAPQLGTPRCLGGGASLCRDKRAWASGHRQHFAEPRTFREGHQCCLLSFPCLSSRQTVYLRDRVELGQTLLVEGWAGFRVQQKHQATAPGEVHAAMNEYILVGMFVVLDMSYIVTSALVASSKCPLSKGIKLRIRRSVTYFLKFGRSKKIRWICIKQLTRVL